MESLYFKSETADLQCVTSGQRASACKRRSDDNMRDTFVIFPFVQSKSGFSGMLKRGQNVTLLVNKWEDDRNNVSVHSNGIGHVGYIHSADDRCILSVLQLGWRVQGNWYPKMSQGELSAYPTVWINIRTNNIELAPTHGARASNNIMTMALNLSDSSLSSHCNGERAASSRMHKNVNIDCYITPRPRIHAGQPYLKSRHMCKDNTSDSSSSLTPGAQYTSAVSECISTTPVNCNRSDRRVEMKGLVLYQSDKRDLVKLEWIDDKVLHCFQLLLVKDHPHFKAPVLQEMYRKLDSCTVQIFHAESDHWILLSNVMSNCNRVIVYDTLRSPISGMRLKQFEAMYGQGIEYVGALVQKQVGYNTCGDYCMAMATCLAHGINPEAVTFNPVGMREHVVTCLENKHFTMFPVL